MLRPYPRPDANLTFPLQPFSVPICHINRQPPRARRQRSRPGFTFTLSSRTHMPTMLQLLLALAGSHPPLVAVDSPPPAPAPPASQQLRAVRLAGGQAVSIDGTLDEPLWQTAERVTGFTQRDPTQGAVPTDG